jgi:predicted membrane channel-forming protein YqfA (hemolysin III family)
MKKRDIWFMSYSTKEIWTNILSVLVGIITAAITFVPLSILSLIILGLIPFGDDLAENRSIYIIMLISIFICSGIGGYVTGLFIERNYLIYSFITGSILTVLYLLLDDFRINNKIFFSIALIIIIPSTLLGSYFPNRNKPKV